MMDEREPPLSARSPDEPPPADLAPPDVEAAAGEGAAPNAAPARRGRARERVERRKQARATGEMFPAPVQDAPRATPRVVAPPRRASAPQVKPAGGRLPASIRLPFDRTLLIAAGSVAFVVIVVIILGSLRNRPADEANNALWLGDEWTYTPADEASVTELAERLRGNEIGTVFAWVSQLLPDQTWYGADNLEAAAQFAASFKAAYPVARLYGWIRVPIDGAAVRLDNDDTQTQIAALSRRVIEEVGCDGVLLHVEPVLSEDDDYLALLRRVRAAIGDAALAVAVPPDWTPVAADVPLPPLIAPGTIWDTTYKQRVALLVDEIIVQTYNTGLSSPTDYSAWVAYQVQAYTAAVAALDGVAVDVFIGIPTYDADPPSFNPAAENIASAAAGLRAGATAAGEAARFLRGAALYAEWTTDARDWDDFRAEWLE